MSDLSFFGVQATWWPYVFIIVAGALTTHIWRYLGVWFADRCRTDSVAIDLARAVATGLVAAVIARFVVFPDGTLADIALGWRVASIATGFALYLACRRSVMAGLVASQAILLTGAWSSGVL